ncbi:MAG: hypothetical protein ACKO97_14655 [Actinomycetota bacterium]
MSNALAIRVIRVVCTLCFVGGIAGMIVASLADNNINAVLTAGIISAIAAIVLLAVSTVSAQRRLTEFDDADAEILEHGIRRLTDAGADEHAVRELVRRAIDLGRRTKRGTPNSPRDSPAKPASDCSTCARACCVRMLRRGT